jgi:hypothetical protein
MDVTQMIAIAGAVAVILSVLLLAYEARQLTQQGRIANQHAGAETNRELLRMFADVHRVFIDHPNLRPHFLDESAVAPSAVEQIRLAVVTEMFADALQVGIESAERLEPYGVYAEAWRGYADTSVANSSMLRDFVRARPEPWAAIAIRVEAYDAARGLKSRN